MKYKQKKQLKYAKDIIILEWFSYISLLLTFQQRFHNPLYALTLTSRPYNINRYEIQSLTYTQVDHLAQLKGNTIQCTKRKI